jgi:hypothetical protein
MPEEYYQQPYRCDGCAFASGTEANRDARTRLVIKLCVEIGQPFYCHERTHQLQNIGLTEANAIEFAKEEGRFPLCRGWVDAFTMLVEKGYYNNQPEWKRELSKRLMGLLEQAEDGLLSKEEMESGAAVRSMIEELMAAESVTK